MPDNFLPETEAQVREVIAGALADRTPLRIHGHDSKAGLGHPVMAARTLDLSGLSGILCYEPEELVLSAHAGTPMAVINAALREARQHLAFEPADWGPLYGVAPGRGTIGGILSCNASGPRRFKAGAARDHFLGFTAINGRGEIFKAGGRVVKNVTGYDLPKLLAGSYGALAVMTEVTLKTLPAPEDMAALVLYDLDDASAHQAMQRAAGSALELSGLAHVPASVASGGRAQTLFRLEGPIASVTARHGMLRTLLKPFGACESLSAEAAHTIWRQVRDADFFLNDGGAVWRISVPPAMGAVVAASIGATQYYYDWAGGLIWLVCDDAARVRLAVTHCGGHATLFRAPDAMRRRVPVFEPPPPALAALNERVRENFDPCRIFNPGRMALVEQA